jgi:Domain of unknown function (DUF3846)
MNQGGYSQIATAGTIRVLIIRPDNSYEVRETQQDIRTWQRLVGGYIGAVHTERCTLWCDEEGKIKSYPTNDLATYLWRKVDPSAEGRDVLQGTVFVTGVADEFGDSLPIPDEVVDLFNRLAEIARKHPE